MTSVHSSSLDADEVDLSGLVESVVDSDEEDMVESIDVNDKKKHFSMFNFGQLLISLIEYLL